MTAAKVIHDYLRTMDIMKKWKNPISNRGIICGRLDLLWGAGWDA